MTQSKNKKNIKNSSENCHFYSREKSLYVAWACFRNVNILHSTSVFHHKVVFFIYVVCFFLVEKARRDLSNYLFIFYHAI